MSDTAFGIFMYVRYRLWNAVETGFFPSPHNNPSPPLWRDHQKPLRFEKTHIWQKSVNRWHSRKKRLKAFAKRLKNPLLIQMHWWLLRKKSTQNRTIKTFQKWLLAFDLSDLTNLIFRKIFDFYFYRIFCEAITNIGRLKDIPTTHTGHSSPCGLYGHT